ncbi:prepilin-type N-terminal cleavage/methylation domain-containing protein, partial [bacterium]|nr:prepilin-type N-terminal cleavage/methylation domain-containing protein [bacterium]
MEWKLLFSNFSICKVRKRKMKKRGFTLIEVLITSFLIFLVFSLIYATFFTLSKTT